MSSQTATVVTLYLSHWIWWIGLRMCAQGQVEGTYSEDEVELFRASRVVQLCAEDQVVDRTNIKGVPQLQVF